MQLGISSFVVGYVSSPTPARFHSNSSRASPVIRDFGSRVEALEMYVFLRSILTPGKREIPRVYTARSYYSSSDPCHVPSKYFQARRKLFLKASSLTSKKQTTFAVKLQRPKPVPTDLYTFFFNYNTGGVSKL